MLVSKRGVDAGPPQGGDGTDDGVVDDEARDEQLVDLVAGQHDTGGGGVVGEEGLDVGDGQLAPLGPMPGVVAGVVGAEQHLEHGAGGDVVALGQPGDAGGDRGDQDAAESKTTARTGFDGAPAGGGMASYVMQAPDRSAGNPSIGRRSGP